MGIRGWARNLTLLCAECAPEHHSAKASVEGETKAILPGKSHFLYNCTRYDDYPDPLLIHAMKWPGENGVVGTTRPSGAILCCGVDRSPSKQQGSNHGL